MSGQSLRNGRSRSCGCYNKELNAQKKKEYRIHNKYDLSNDDYGIGFTQKGEQFLFDKEDYELIYPYIWRLNELGYVVARDYDAKKNLRMHRLIMHVDDSKQVIDHRNHNPQDNRKINLRITNQQANGKNQKKRITNTSGYTGVCWDKDNDKWAASITVNYKHIRLGRFNKIEDAVRARKEAEEKYFGEYSFDNSIKIAEDNMIKLKENGNAQG